MSRYNSFVLNTLSSSRRLMVVASTAALTTLLTVACSQGAAPSAAAPASASATSPAPAPGVVTLLEPAEGAFSGHVDTFRWAAVVGADGYHLKVSTLAGRVVWESPLIAAAEGHLPATVSLEPEGHVWQVTAMKGAEAMATSAAGRFTVTP